MPTVPRVLAFAAAAAVVGALDGGAARLLMRGIALTMYQRPGFGLSATLFRAIRLVERLAARRAGASSAPSVQ
ncbi:hypothetical protein ACVGVM_14015 [Pseudonocardia bannensis]|uniref:Uncharacterized protein n=1 Tax=Pseudonocardia bannensis TaxID=630973 RepID=A0A848DKW1_9PSEU|nr:hypothetical protein [Pseudonocardia bannensis]NMH93332.1 hypothetical protein [Pseudonocardia bannensis]